MRRIEVVDYDPSWPDTFESLRSILWPALADVASSIEHVGSTSVPGLAAKPIIDISIVVPGNRDVQVGISRLATLG
ncbi:MAG: GrpB family protein [Verrucomicrobia bacterium]|nr:GrpB family protein [Verrucomicrobiota bacterium]